MAGTLHEQAGASSESAWTVGGWDGGGDRPGAKAPLHDQRIGDGEVACLRLPVATRRQRGARHRQVNEGLRHERLE